MIELGSGNITNEESKHHIYILYIYTYIPGLCSTPLLHNITRDKNEEGYNVKLYTVDSNKKWLDKFSNLQSEYHKHILVNYLWTEQIDLN